MLIFIFCRSLKMLFLYLLIGFFFSWKKSALVLLFFYQSIFCFKQKGKSRGSSFTWQRSFLHFFEGLYSLKAFMLKVSCPIYLGQFCFRGWDNKVSQAFFLCIFLSVCIFWSPLFWSLVYEVGQKGFFLAYFRC